jgi:hypothetical protein
MSSNGVTFRCRKKSDEPDCQVFEWEQKPSRNQNTRKSSRWRPRQTIFPELAQRPGLYGTRLAGTEDALYEWQSVFDSVFGLKPGLLGTYPAGVSFLIVVDEPPLPPWPVSTWGLGVAGFSIPAICSIQCGELLDGQRDRHPESGGKHIIGLRS